MMEYETIVELGLLDGLAAVVHETAKEKGFWDEEVDVHFILSKIALIHSEVSEVLEAVRKNKGEDEITEEMADTLIRLIDLFAGMKNAGLINTSLDSAMKSKMKTNTNRQRLHGNLA